MPKKKTRSTPILETVDLAVKDIARFWNCSPMLAKKRLEKEGVRITRMAGQAYVRCLAGNPLAQKVAMMKAQEAAGANA